jgi:hypothetical protein
MVTNRFSYNALLVLGFILGYYCHIAAQILSMQPIPATNNYTFGESKEKLLTL